MKLDQWTGLHLMIYFAALWGSIYTPFAHDCRASQEHVLRQVSSSSKPKRRNTAEREALLNIISPRGIRKLLALGRHACRHNLFFMVIYISVIVRYLLTRLVSISGFSDYHLLDCFILGRIRSVGRMYLIGPLATGIIQALFFYYRYKLTYGTSSGPQFQVFKFLLHDYEEVLANEIAYHAGAHWCPHSSGAFDASQQAEWREVAKFERKIFPMSGSLREPLITEQQLDGLADKLMRRRKVPAPSLVAHRRDPLFYAHNSLRDEDTSCENSFRRIEPEWILRPNRTSASWRIMAKVTVYWFWASVMGFLFNFIFLTLIMIPPTVTPMGFEIYYPACARWLQRHQQAELADSNDTSYLLANDRVMSIDYERDSRLQYSSIYLAVGRHLACDRAIGDVPVLQLFSDDPQILPWTSYQTCRFIVDAALTYLFYIDFGLVFCAHLYILLLISMDVVLNTLDIRRRLLQLLDELFQSCHHDHAERIENKQVYAHLQVPHKLACSESKLDESLNQRPSLWQLHKRRQHEQLNAHIISLQSLLMDHFRMIRSYNHFVSHYLLMLLVTLFAFSGAFTLLIFTLKDKAIEQEFLVSGSLSIFFTIPLFAGPCVTHIYNLQLNSLISRAMALDSTSSLTKSRWIVLMRHYQPIPLYCFTLFERTPVSWLFCLKLVAWCFSAGFVLANFLYVY